MGFDYEWDNCYASNTHNSIWPWSDVVSLLHRHCKHLIQGKNTRVLELGCGAGANIPFLSSLGFDYSGVDGSPTVVSCLHKRYPDLASRIHAADFTSAIPFEGEFDLILDRASVTHNSTASIESALSLAFAVLKKGGSYLGVDWFSTSHSDFSLGDAVDNYTKTNYQHGSFAGVGCVHFSDEDHLRRLFSDFSIIYLEEKRAQRFVPPDSHLFASWNLVATKN